MLLWLIKSVRRWWAQRQAGGSPAPAGPGVRPTGNPLPKLFVASVKMMARDRRTVVFSLVVPLLFAVIFGLQHFGAQQHAKLIVVPSGRTQFDRRVLRGLDGDAAFRVTQSSDLAAARKKLHDGDVDLVVTIPAAPGRLTAYYKPGTSNQDFALGGIRRFVDATNLRLAGVSSPPVQLVERSIEAKDTNYYDFVLPGLIAWAVFNLSVIGIAISVARYREQQILKRILATPLRPGLFLLATVASRLVLSVAQAAVILVVAVGGFDAHVHGDPFWIFFYVALGNLVFLNIGFAIAGRAKSTDSAQSLAQLVALPMVFLSGVFFPTSGLPTVLGQIVRLLPLTPLATALRKITLDGDAMTATAPQLALLLAWLVISFAVARQSFRFGEEPARRRLALRPG